MSTRAGSRRKRRFSMAPSGRVLLLVVGVGLSAFVIGYGITALAFRTARAPSDVVLVPDLRELTVTEAARRLSDQSLDLTVGDSLPNPDIPAGAILAQSPLPGEEVSPATEVRVIISTGQVTPMIPEIESMPVALATRALQAAGFDVVIEEVPGEGEPGRVFRVEPAPGTPLAIPATVALQVGAPPPFMPMPAVTDMQEDAAREVLQEAGLRVSEVLYESSDSMAPYRVLWQEPAAGDSVNLDIPVRLRVALPAVIGADSATQRSPDPVGFD